jgi:Na+-transporting NADH:ubiquinone oxidoreductase subunit A
VIKVSLGQPIFHDKSDESIKIASPVSGKIVEIVRGAKRKILNIIIKREGDRMLLISRFQALSNIAKDKILELLVESCSLAFIRQRPYNIIARPDRLPKSIFVSIHSTAPYAADYAFILKNRMDEFQTGVDVMSRLIDKPINLSIPHNCESDFTSLQNVDIYKIKGAHPSGNESFQINRIDPLNSGEIVWVIKPEDLANIGSFFKTGIYNPKRTVACVWGFLEIS